VPRHARDKGGAPRPRESPEPGISGNSPSDPIPVADDSDSSSRNSSSLVHLQQLLPGATVGHPSQPLPASGWDPVMAWRHTVEGPAATAPLKDSAHKVAAGRGAAAASWSPAEEMCAPPSLVG
jgi:hypothetical protein